MLFLGYLSKLYGLKGEFILYKVIDCPELFFSTSRLFLVKLMQEDNVNIWRNLIIGKENSYIKVVKVIYFRMHNNKMYLLFDGISDRTMSELYLGWSLLTDSNLPILPIGESYRYEWIGCEVFASNKKIGEVARLYPASHEYDMVVVECVMDGHLIKEINIPYIKKWFTSVDLVKRRIEVDLPDGLLEL